MSDQRPKPTDSLKRLRAEAPKSIHDDDEEARKGRKKKEIDEEKKIKEEKAFLLAGLVYISFHYYVLTLMRYLMYNNIVSCSFNVSFLLSALRVDVCTT